MLSKFFLLSKQIFSKTGIFQLNLNVSNNLIATSVTKPMLVEKKKRGFSVGL